jgi:peptidoglycan/LPS O-acetylase OafA/YrhL
VTRHHERFQGLDGLRALAVIGVVWNHTHVGFDALQFTRRGFLGVDVFFVLSGFLITALLLREREQSGRIAIGQFYMRRALRIFPLYYAVVALVALLYGTVRAGTANAAGFFADLPFLLTYTLNWVESEPVTILRIAWSLAAEEQFYLVWPPLFAVMGVASLWLLVPFLVLNQLVNFGMLDGWLASHGLRYEGLEILQCTFTPILLGVSLALAHGSRRTRMAVPALGNPATAIAALMMMIVAASQPDPIRGWPRLTFQAGTRLLLAAIVARPSMRVVQALDWRPLAYVGTISYGIYLLHLLCADVVSRLLARAGMPASGLMLFVATLGVTIIVAGLSFRYFERPWLALKDRYRGRNLN